MPIINMVYKKPRELIKEWDFTAYTSISDITSDGLILSSLLSLNQGNGLTVANVGGAEKYGTICYDISDKIGSIKTMVLDIDCSISNNTYASGVIGGFIDVSGAMYSSNEIYGGVFGNTSNTSQTIQYRSTTLASQNQLMSAGTYHMQNTFNLETGVIDKVITGTGSLTQTATLTSEQISYIRSNEKYVYIRTGWGNYAQHFVKKMKVKLT